MRYCEIGVKFSFHGISFSYFESNTIKKIKFLRKEENFPFFDRRLLINQIIDKKDIFLIWLDVLLFFFYNLEKTILFPLLRFFVINLSSLLMINRIMLTNF